MTPRPVDGIQPPASPPAPSLVLVYTGEGKGKTSAALGQVVRALGHGKAVAFAQCMKRADVAGEQAWLRQALGDRFQAGGLGFLRRGEDVERHRKAAREVLGWCLARLREGRLFLLVLDEALYALGSGLLGREDVQGLTAAARTAGCHLVLTGRGCPDWLQAEADLVSELQSLKHPFERGVPAVEGLDF